MSQINVAATAARQATGDELVLPRAEIAAKHPANRAVEAFAEALIVLTLLGELLLVLANVFARVCRSVLFYGPTRRRGCRLRSWLSSARPSPTAAATTASFACYSSACLVLADIIVLFVVGLVGFAALQFIASSWGERTPVLQLPAALIALPLPLGMALLALFALDNLVRSSARRARPLASSCES